MSPSSTMRVPGPLRVGVGDDGGREERLRVRVLRRREELRRAAPSSTILPRYITATRSQRNSTVARSCVMKRHEKPMLCCRSREQVEDRRLHRDVERRHGLVGDQERRRDRQRPGEADPLALAAGELVRVAVAQLAAQADLVEELGRRARRASRPPRDAGAAAAARRRSAPHVMRGLSDEYGSWKTMCTSRRSGRISRRERCVTSTPRIRIVPSVGSTQAQRCSCRPSTCPLPDSPTSPSISPGPMRRARRRRRRGRSRRRP